MQALAAGAGTRARAGYQGEAEGRGGWPAAAACPGWLLLAAAPFCPVLQHFLSPLQIQQHLERQLEGLSGAPRREALLQRTRVPVRAFLARLRALQAEGVVPAERAAATRASVLAACAAQQQPRCAAQQQLNGGQGLDTWYRLPGAVAAGPGAALAARLEEGTADAGTFRRWLLEAAAEPGARQVAEGLVGKGSPVLELIAKVEPLPSWAEVRLQDCGYKGGGAPQSTCLEGWHRE